MKQFDIRVNINPETYLDEYTLVISDEKRRDKYILDVEELFDLYEEVRHTVETNIA